MGLLADLYVALFSRSSLSKVNNRVLSMATRARGYNNFRNNRESGESFFIKKVLGKSAPKLCFDIGANIGGYSLEILENTTANVIAFEPLPTAYKELAQRTQSFGNRIVLENMGVGKKNEELTIHYNPSALAHASFAKEANKVSYVKNNEQAIVPVVTLDWYCEQHKITDIDFIKIDTEGFESEVFEGAQRVFSIIRPKFIQIEFNWHHLFRNTSLNYFSEQLIDYDVYQLLRDGWAKRDPRDPFSNIYHFSNFVFVRKE
jgi:FkbM family methyltransferase